MKSYLCLCFDCPWTCSERTSPPPTPSPSLLISSLSPNLFPSPFFFPSTFLFAAFSLPLPPSFPASFPLLPQTNSQHPYTYTVPPPSVPRETSFRWRPKAAEPGHRGVHKALEGLCGRCDSLLAARVSYRAYQICKRLSVGDCGITELRLRALD